MDQKKWQSLRQRDAAGNDEDSGAWDVPLLFAALLVSIALFLYVAFCPFFQYPKDDYGTPKVLPHSPR
jgi:hypothetical protein